MQRFGSKAPARRTYAAYAYAALAVGTLLSALCWTEHVCAQSGLAGTYEPSPQRMEVKVTTWGEDCGTRPQSQTLNESGKVVVKDEGAHLSLRFSTRTVRTNSCWSQNPSLALVSATSGSGRYRAECRTTAGDPKREQGRYSVNANAGTLELSEESDYDWQLKTSHCVAKVRVTQTLTALNQAKPAAVPDAGQPVAPAPTPAPPPPAEDERCTPGAAQRLRMRPPDARLAPGERVCFVVRAVDAAGCPLAQADAAIELTLQRPAAVQGTLSGGCFKAAESAALAEGVFKVQASSGNLRAEASVVVSAPDLSDITARRAGSGAAPLGTTGRTTETQYETGVRAVQRDARDTWWLGIGVAALAGVLTLAAVVALRRARNPKKKRSVRPRSSLSSPRLSDATTQERQPGADGAPLPAPAELLIAGGPQRICPRCRRGYPPGSERCAADGEALVDYADFASSQELKAAPRFCPECGEQLASDAVFCGRCGHKLARD